MEPRKCLATVKLNAYTGGYYDPITRIHLTIGNPTANLYAGMNLTGIRKAIRSGTLSVISGHIDGLAPEFKLERRGNKFVLVPNKKASITVNNVEPAKLNIKSSRVKKIQQAQQAQEAQKVEQIRTAPDLPAPESVQVTAPVAEPVEMPVEVPATDPIESVTTGVSDIETLGSLVDFPSSENTVEEPAQTEDGEQTRQKKKKHKH